MRFGWKGWLGVALTAFLIWWAFRGVDPREVWAGVLAADFLVLLLAVGVATFGYLIRAMRWRVLLDPVYPGTSLGARFAAVCVGFMANNLLPARAGEFARPFALSRLEPVPLTGGFGSLVVERFLDTVALLALLLVAMAAPSFPRVDDAGTLSEMVSLGTKATAVLLAGMFVLVIWPKPIVRSAEFVARSLPGRLAPRVVGALESFLEGFAVMRHPRPLASAVVWTVFFWAWNTFAFWIGLRAFGIEVDFIAALFLNSVVAFAVALPSAPGYFGTFQVGVRFALITVYGAEEGASLAFAFGYHVAGFIPITILGLWYARRLGITLGEVGRSEDEVESGLERIPGPLPSASSGSGPRG